MIKYDDKFEGCLVETSNQTMVIGKSEEAYLVTNQLLNVLRQWKVTGYHEAVKLAAGVRLPDPSSGEGMDGYPREYPLEVDWTRI